jgi:plasmid stabilization system protein ParE
VPHSVRISRRALREIDAALAWLAERSRAAADRWHGRLLEAIRSLEDNPGRCPLAPEDECYEGGELRQFLHGKRRGVYRILFEVRGDVVYILRVRHSAQDLLKPEDF